MLCYVLDVTAQVEAERAALAARAELERCLRASPEGICGLDRDWRITHWNPAAERMLDRSRAEVLGRELWEVFPELRGTAFHRAFDEALADGHLRVVEDRAPRGRSWYAVTAVPSAAGALRLLLQRHRPAPAGAGVPRARRRAETARQG